MMKKIAIILACMLACFALFTGCANQKDGGGQDTNMGNSVEIDGAGIEIGAEPGPDMEGNPGNAALPDGFAYSFRDPDHADGITVTPKE